MNKLTVRDLEVRGKRVFLRVDFNVPMTEDGKISDLARIVAALPTLQYLLNHGACVILASHLGKAKGKPDPRFSLHPILPVVSQLVGSPVTYAPVYAGDDAAKVRARALPGTVTLLENLRFHPGEAANDPSFARELASLADVYVNDAFGAAHRAHASTVGMASLFAQPAAGLLMETEVDYLTRILEHPTRPYVAIIGGSKVSDKAGVISNLLPRIDHALLGGAAALNIMAARGGLIGRSRWQPDLAERIRPLAADPKLVLPPDQVVASGFEDEAGATTVKSGEIPADRMGLDIGPESARLFAGILQKANTIVWAGPMGVFEHDAFSAGTLAVAQAVAAATDRGATTVVGGGDTGAALTKFGFAMKMSHVSTGGGASLEFLEGKPLPGVAALSDRK
jgi:3-phosphoglycerate kinase